MVASNHENIPFISHYPIKVPLLSHQLGPQFVVELDLSLETPHGVLSEVVVIPVTTQDYLGH
jgi:hypothetical protein